MLRGPSGRRADDYERRPRSYEQVSPTSQVQLQVALLQVYNSANCSEYISSLPKVVQGTYCVRLASCVIKSKILPRTSPGHFVLRVVTSGSICPYPSIGGEEGAA